MSIPEILRLDFSPTMASFPRVPLLAEILVLLLLVGSRFLCQVFAEAQVNIGVPGIKDDVDNDSTPTNPECGVECTELYWDDWGSDNTRCDADEWTCQCNDRYFVTRMGCCIHENCSSIAINPSQLQARVWLEWACDDAGIRLPSPLPCFEGALQETLTTPTPTATSTSTTSTTSSTTSETSLVIPTTSMALTPSLPTTVPHGTPSLTSTGLSPTNDLQADSSGGPPVSPLTIALSVSLPIGILGLSALLCFAWRSRRASRRHHRGWDTDSSPSLSCCGLLRRHEAHDDSDVMVSDEPYYTAADGHAQASRYERAPISMRERKANVPGHMWHREVEPTTPVVEMDAQTAAVELPGWEVRRE